MFSIHHFYPLFTLFLTIIFFCLLQQRGLDSSTKDRNETFMSHKEVALAANKQTRGLKEPSNDLFGHQRKKVSHSGPLVHGAAWEKVGKRPDHPPTISTRSNLSTLSGFVASRTGSTEDFQGKSGPSRPGAVRPVGRSQSSFRELSTGKQEYRQNNHKVAESPQGVAGNGIVKEASLVSSLALKCYNFLAILFSYNCFIRLLFPCFPAHALQKFNYFALKLLCL